MQASSFMQKPVAVHADAHVKYALDKMRDTGYRALPVVDAEGRAVGLLSARSVIAHLVPDYIVSGDLDDVPYAPDFGLLRKHYDAVKDLQVSELMDEPFIIKSEESLLSVAAALVTHATHDCVLVVDGDNRLVGIITASDVLGIIRGMHSDRPHAA
jgi:CBS domain-containing protein